MSAMEVPKFYTENEYLELERKATYKSEYVNGQIYAMAGASRMHNTISGNTYSQINIQLIDRVSCEAHTNDMRVKVEETGLITYPDVVAVCGDVELDDSYKDTLLNPKILIEVLSPSTEAYDRGAKFAHYRKLPSLEEYVLISQHKVLVELFQRHGEHWILKEYSHLEDVLALDSIDCQIKLSRIYNKVVFPPEQIDEIQIVE